MIAGQIKRREDNKNFDITIEDEKGHYTIENINKYLIQKTSDELQELYSLPDLDLIMWLDNWNKTIFEKVDYIEVV